MSTDTPIEDAPGQQDIASLYTQAGALLISYQEHVVAWQREALRIAFAEISLFQSGVLTAMRALMQRPGDPDNEQQRFLGFTDMWLRLATELQAALIHAFAPPALVALQRPALPDRRVRSVVINFPERRAA